MRPLRIASYNTRDFLDDREAAARVVRAIAPDVLCLQEVPRRLFAPTRVARFAAQVGMVWPARHRGSGGTTIFTAPHVEVDVAEHRRLPVRWPDRTRGYAVARLRLPGHQPLTVVSVHLSLKAEERLRHTRSILGTLDVGRRTVVCGDLNEDERGPAAGLVAGGLRLISPPEPTYPAAGPQRRLDLIFASPDVATAPGAPVALVEADIRAASDHRPVWVDLTAW